MPSFWSSSTAPGAFRCLAGGLALLVLALTVLTVAPAAHEHLHDDAAHSEHSCAVVLFAHGLIAATIGLLFSRRSARLDAYEPAPIFTWVRRPAHQWPHACGPPDA